MVYSRLAKIEKRKAKRTIVIYGILTIASLVLIFFFGINFLSQFSGFILNLKGSSAPIQINDTTPPAPPRFDTIPDVTNKTNIQVTGSSEPGATIVASINGKTKEVVVGSDGQFLIDIALNKGTNLLKAKAKDKSGNESANSKVYTITFDDTPPELEITKPQNDESFGGSSQKQITIEGRVEPEATLKLNDRVVIISENGNFSTSFSLQDGKNDLNFVATDRAGNQTEKTISVNFSP